MVLYSIQRVVLDLLEQNKGYHLNQALRRYFCFMQLPFSYDYVQRRYQIFIAHANSRAALN